MNKDIAFKIESLKLGPHQKMTFKEFVNYKLNTNRVFRFSEFTKICGISRKQWDVFRIENKGNKDIKWIIE